MFKRLGRLPEAEADLKLGLEKASDGLVLRDIRYNLACVYALRGQRELMLTHLRMLKDAKREMGYGNDAEFLALINHG